MTVDHYLAGPCDGIVISRDGDTVTIHDENGRELRQQYTFANSDIARRAVWSIRDEFYAKYEARP